MNLLKLNPSITVMEGLQELAKENFKKGITDKEYFVDVDDYLRLLNFLGSRVEYIEPNGIKLHFGFGAFRIFPHNGEDT